MHESFLFYFRTCQFMFLLSVIMGGTLVVCPASLLSQWYNEIANHCKRHSLRAEIHHGNKRETKPNHLARNDVVITTYNIVQRDVEKVLYFIRKKIPFHVEFIIYFLFFSIRMVY